MTRWAGILRALLTTALLALLVSRFDMAEAWARIVAGSPLWLLMALAAMLAQTVLAALRWQVTARAYGLAIAAPHAIREYFLAQIVNQSLPGGVLGDVGRAFRARNTGANPAGISAGLARAGASVLAERLWGQAALLAVMLAAVIAVTLTPGGLALPGPLVASLTVAVAGIALAAALLPMLPGRVGQAARGVWRGMAAPGLWPRQAALSLATTAANLLAFAFCARATGTVLSPAAILTLVPVILFTMVVPLTISGWGLREGAAAALFPLAGASAEAGLAASVIFGLAFLVSSLPGLPVLLLGSPRAAAAASPAGGRERAVADGVEPPIEIDVSTQGVTRS